MTQDRDVDTTKFWHFNNIMRTFSAKREYTMTSFPLGIRKIILNELRLLIFRLKVCGWLFQEIKLPDGIYFHVFMKQILRERERERERERFITPTNFSVSLNVIHLAIICCGHVELHVHVHCHKDWMHLIDHNGLLQVYRCSCLKIHLSDVIQTIWTQVSPTG